MRQRIVGVIGPAECDAATLGLAGEVGARLAQAGCAVVTGGLGGVMEAASRGAHDAGGLVIGILPGASPAGANAFVDVAIATGMGEARNLAIVHTALAFVAIGHGFGTLSEIAFALKAGKPVVSLGSWRPDPAVVEAATPEEAVRLVLGCISSG